MRKLDIQYLKHFSDLKFLDKLSISRNKLMLNILNTYTIIDQLCSTSICAIHAERLNRVLGG